MYLLDTDIVSYLLRKHSSRVDQVFASHAPSVCAISAITLSELLFGAENTSRSAQYRVLIAEFIRIVRVLDWPVGAAEYYGRIRKRLETSGQTIGNMDMLIAAHAQALGYTLVTNNTKHFTRIKGLRVENWSRS